MNHIIGIRYYSNMHKNSLTSYLLMSSSDNLCKVWNSLDPDQARQNVESDLDRNCLTLWWYCRIFFISWFWKKSADDKKHKKFPVGKELNMHE